MPRAGAAGGCWPPHGRVLLVQLHPQHRAPRWQPRFSVELGHELLLLLSCRRYAAPALMLSLLITSRMLLLLLLLLPGLFRQMSGPNQGDADVTALGQAVCVAQAEAVLQHVRHALDGDQLQQAVAAVGRRLPADQTGEGLHDEVRSHGGMIGGTRARRINPPCHRGLRQ